MYLQKKNAASSKIKSENIAFIFKEIFKGMSFKFLLPKDFINTEKSIANPEMNIFYWCILSNRLEIAKTFWLLGKVKFNNFI